MIKYDNLFYSETGKEITNCMRQPASALKQEEEKNPVVIHSWLYVENPSKSMENLLELWSETDWVNQYDKTCISLYLPKIRKSIFKKII